jgi:hypothetical protein
LPDGSQAGAKRRKKPRLKHKTLTPIIKPLLVL